MSLLLRPLLACTAGSARTFAMLTLALTSGCATMPPPRNLDGAKCPSSDDLAL